jgi:hypothetical protein
MFFRSRRLMRWGSRAIWLSYSNIGKGKLLGLRPAAYFFLPAMGFALPLRVRALVWVR